MRDVKFVESECSREFGRIVMVCQTSQAYDAIMELLNDGKVIQ